MQELSGSKSHAPEKRRAGRLGSSVKLPARSSSREQTMAIKTYRPITPTLRFQTSQVNDDITTQTPHKALVVTRPRTGGRRNAGDLTMRHHGGGHKRQLRLID